MTEAPLRLVGCGLDVLISPQTGLPISLRSGSTTQQVRGALHIETGGLEERTPWGGLVYPGAERHEAVDGVAHLLEEGAAQVRLRAGPAAVVVRYQLREQHPRLRVDIEITNPTAAELLVRDVLIDLDLAADDHSQVSAPGNRIRPGLALADLDRVAVNGPGGTPGSTGLAALSTRQATTLVWPLCRDALGTMDLSRSEAGCRMQMDTRLAAAIPPEGGLLSYRSLWVDVLEQPWEQVRPQIRQWYGDLGIELPHDQPDWTRSASILEVQLGTSLFGTGFRYAPHPQVSDVLADLPRIASLGFDTLQIMPRQPFPSYAVIDHHDIAASYGDPDQLQALVQAAGERGIRVILDVVMHGVTDKETVRLVADAVRAGPHGPFLASHRSYRLDDAAELPWPGQVPWSQHILDFEEAWYEGAPTVHPLLHEHPEWFYRDSAGETTSVYTRAIDIGHPEWQQDFLAALRALIETLGIHGFRFDAPTYNGYPNWSERTRSRASASSTAAYGLFRMLRQALRPQYPELMFYTEPSGVLLRESMDLVYNYDEHAQLEDLMGHRGAALGAEGTSAAGVRHARDLAAWWAERDAVLPPRAVTAHHIDSHDTFWWPRPGSKWRREQVGLAATAALASIFALSGGPYMTFVGGELGIEDHLTALHRVRRRPEFREGRLDFESVRWDADDVYVAVRSRGDRAALVLVNVSPERCEGLELMADHWQVSSAVDLLSEQAQQMRGHGPRFTMDLEPYETRVLALQPAP